MYVSKIQLFFCSCAVMPNDDFVLCGTYNGEVQMFNKATGQEESSYPCHESSIFHIQPSKDCSLMLTSR